MGSPMVTRPSRPRREPQRLCVVCRVPQGKRQLVRLALSADGQLQIDESGKGPGRGAYLCRRQVCWHDRSLASRLGRALRTTLKADDVRLLSDYARGLPPDTGPSAVSPDERPVPEGWTADD